MNNEYDLDGLNQIEPEQINECLQDHGGNYQTKVSGQEIKNLACFGATTVTGLHTNETQILPNRGKHDTKSNRLCHNCHVLAVKQAHGEPGVPRYLRKEQESHQVYQVGILPGHLVAQTRQSLAEGSGVEDSGYEGFVQLNGMQDLEASEHEQYQCKQRIKNVQPCQKIIVVSHVYLVQVNFEHGAFSEAGLRGALPDFLGQ